MYYNENNELGILPICERGKVMRKFAIVTDATADLAPEYIRAHSITVLPMEFTLGEQSYTHYPDCRELSIEEFYTRLKAGEPVGTTQVNLNHFLDCFEGIVKYDMDVLYVGFSSGISGTYQVSNMAAQEVGANYPDAKIVCVDSLSTTVGLNVMVEKADELRSQGKSIEETAQWLQEHAGNLHHWFGVDDLQHLRRGGRISPLAATLGTALGIKPVLQVMPDGTLDVRAKVRGNKKCIEYLMEKFETYCTDRTQCVRVVHAANPLGAMMLCDELKKRGASNTEVSKLGPIVGAHTGAGLLGVVFFGEPRESK